MTFLLNKSVASFSKHHTGCYSLPVKFTQRTCTLFLWKGSTFPLIFPEAKQWSGFSESCFVPELTCVYFYREAFEWLDHLIPPWYPQALRAQGSCFLPLLPPHPFTSLFRGHWLMKKVDHVSEVCKPSFRDTSTCKGISKGIWSLDLLPKAPDHGAQVPQIRGSAHEIYDARVCYQTGWHASTTPR